MWSGPRLWTLVGEPCRWGAGNRSIVRGMAVKAFRGMKRKRRKRLDEYDRYSVGLRMKVWEDVVKGEGFYPYMFEDMSPTETSKTVFLAIKMNVQSKAFWDRASLAVGDIASALNARQLTSTCYALSIAKARDTGTVQALVPAVACVAPKLRPGDLAVMVQSFARMKVRNAAIMTSLAQAIQADTRLNCKGFAMIITAFAELKFQSQGFYSRLGQWAVRGGTHRCGTDETISILQSLSVLLTSGSRSKNQEDLVVAISNRVSNMLEELEPSALVATVTALGKLRASNPELLNKLQQTMLHEMNQFHVSSLPGVLDSMINLHLSIDDGCSGLLDCTERRFFYSQLTGRLSRQLRHLHPQSACRALQALERAGIVDTRLLANTASMLPERLASFPAEQILKLLQAYANAGNRDGLMVNFLRRALLPLKAQTHENDPRTPIDNATLAQLDDVGVALVAEAFATLTHWEGVLSVMIAIGAPGSFRNEGREDIIQSSHGVRQVARTCEIAIGGSAGSLLQTQESWNAALRSFAETEPAMGSLDIALGPEVREAWVTFADASNSSADELLLALVAFPANARHLFWVRSLVARIDECSISLLPSIFLAECLSPDDHDHESLRGVAENEFLRRLPYEGSGSLPIAAIIGALRGLAQCAKSNSQDLPKMAQRRQAAEDLASSLVNLVDESCVGVKSLVRALQSFEALQMEPCPVLVSLFSQRCSTLLPFELIVSLRSLSAKSISKAGCNNTLASVASRAMTLLRSSRQAWELQALCSKLDLDIRQPDVAVEAEDDETPQETILSKERQLRT